jgi:hypothetical protein
MKNLAEFKRRCKPGAILAYTHYGVFVRREPDGTIIYKESEPAPRKVLKVRSADIVFLKPPHWGETYCGLGKSAEWEIAGDTATNFYEERGQRMKQISYRFFPSLEEGEEFVAAFMEKCVASMQGR